MSCCRGKDHIEIDPCGKITQGDSTNTFCIKIKYCGCSSFEKINWSVLQYKTLEDGEADFDSDPIEIESLESEDSEVEFNGVIELPDLEDMSLISLVSYKLSAKIKFAHQEREVSERFDLPVSIE